MKHNKERGPLAGQVPSVALYALAGALLVCAGCVPAPGAYNAFYVLIPYAVALVCVVRAAMLEVRIAHDEPALRRDDPATRGERLTGWLFVGMACSFLAVVGEVAHLLRAGPAALGWGLAFATLCAGAGGCLLMLWKRSKRE